MVRNATADVSVARLVRNRAGQAYQRLSELRRAFDDLWRNTQAGFAQMRALERLETLLTDVFVGAEDRASGVCAVGDLDDGAAAAWTRPLRQLWVAGPARWPDDDFRPAAIATRGVEIAGRLAHEVVQDCTKERMPVPPVIAYIYSAQLRRRTDSAWLPWQVPRERHE